MKVKALVSFAGMVTMARGEERDILDENVCKDLLRAKYVEELKNKTTRRKVKSDED